jgi:hypothetical protein
MRRLVGWFGGLAPRMQGFLVVLLLPTPMVLILNALVGPTMSSLFWLACYVTAALLIVWLSLFVERVAQAKIDLAADAVAMRDAIERLERGDR